MAAVCAPGLVVKFPLHHAVPVTSSWSEFPQNVKSSSSEFPRESPESWTKEQRALVKRTVDLGGLAVSPTRRAELVEEIRAAAEVGLFFISNFGVDMALVDDVRRLTKRFFEQPVEEKLKCTKSASMEHGSVGYAYKWSSAVGSHMEANARFREEYRLLAYPEARRGENAWPAHQALSAFREKVELYVAQMHRVANFLQGLLAEGLGLPESYITDQYGPLMTSVSLSSTPPQEIPQGQIPAPALAAHCDPDMFNIKLSDGARGVQYYVHGQWLTTPALLDEALVHLGNDIETISNGRYHAMYHRVLSGAQTQISLLTTAEIGADAMVAPAAQLVDAHNPVRYRSRRQDALRPDRTKATLLLDPASHLDTTRKIYMKDGREYMDGQPVVDWGITLQDCPH